MNLERDLVLHTKIKEEEDNASNVIDLELDKSPEDLVYEWNSKVRLKFKNYSTIDNEHSLDILMKWYIKTIEEEAVNLEDVHNLKLFTANHMQFLKLSFLELNCCFVDNYLDSMEEILSFYVNLEVKSVPAKKKDGNKRVYKRLLVSVCHKIISFLNLYLLKRDDRIYQVIMKVKLNSLSEESKDLLNHLYGNFLTKRPKDKSDLGFCRAYILYQKWKTIKKSEDWEKMDEVMYNLHERTSDSIKTNPVLKQILLPQSNSILDTLTHISENHLIIAKEYFKYIKSNKVQDDNIMTSVIGNIDVQDDDIDIIWDSGGDVEDQEFESAYKNFVKSMSSIHLEKNQSVTVKSENASDSEDCEIVSVSFVENDPEDIIHEILDDDEDDIEIIYRKKKDDKQKTTPKNEEKSTALSFLESIEATHSRDVSTERVSSSTNNGCTDLPPANNPVETSHDAKLVTADSPTSNFRQKTSETPNTDVVTSVAQTEPLQEASSLESELNNNSSKTERAASHGSEEKTVNDVPESNVAPVERKTVASIETQTDEWLADDGQDKTPLEKHPQQNGAQRGYYYYGLDTPPSDQRPDEHISPVAESAAYPNVYVNIVSPNEPGSLAKATDTDSLSSSADDNDVDNSGKVSSRFDDLMPPSTVQNESGVGKYERKLTDSEYMPSAEISTKKKHKKSKKTSENDPNLLDEAFIPYVKPNTKKKRRKMDEPPEDYSNGLGVAYLPEIDPNAKKKRKILDKTPENNLNLLASSVEVNKKKKRKKLEEPSDPEVKSKKKRKKSSRTAENDSVLRGVEANTKTRICLDAEENVIFEDPTSLPAQERCLVTIGEGVSSREDVTDLRNVSSLGISTTGYLEAYTCHQTNPRSPFGYGDGNVCETSSNVPCTSMDFIVTSAESIEISFNDQNQLPDVSNNSPDVTSTSTDVQDLVRTDFAGNDQSYGHLNEDMLEIEEHGVNDVGYCFTVGGEYDNGENVTQSNIEDVVEEAILVQNHFPEDISDVGRSSVVVSEENLVGYVQEIEIPAEKRSKRDSPRKVTFSIQEKFVEPSVEEFLKVERWSKLREKHNLDEAFSGPVAKIVNPDTNFDLFSSNFPDCAPQPSNFAVQSTSEVTSPAYEGIDDFRTYYEESKNSAGVVTTPSTSAEETVSIVTPDRRSEAEARVKTPKKVLIRDTVVSSRHSVPQLDTDAAKNVHLRGILKKSPPKVEGRVPPCHMNLKSLRLYGVQPNDDLLQREPFVEVKKLTEGFIAQWEGINKIAREVRLRKSNWGASSAAIKVDYDKRILRIGTDDVVEYIGDGKPAKKTPADGLGRWRCNSVGRPDEGLQELPYTEKKTGKRKSQNIRITYNTPKKGPGRPRKTI